MPHLPQLLESFHQAPAVGGSGIGDMWICVALPHEACVCIPILNEPFFLHHETYWPQIPGQPQELWTRQNPKRWQEFTWWGNPSLRHHLFVMKVSLMRAWIWWCITRYLVTTAVQWGWWRRAGSLQALWSCTTGLAKLDSTQSSIWTIKTATIHKFVHHLISFHCMQVHMRVQQPFCDRVKMNIMRCAGKGASRNKQRSGLTTPHLR